MSNDTPEYVTHNFSAVDKHILEIAKREKARTFAYQLKSIRLIFLYGLAVILMVALVPLVTSWSYRIWNKPYVSEVVKAVRPDIIEREVLKIVEVPVDNVTNSDFPEKLFNSSNNTGDEVTGSPVVTNYNIFRIVKTPKFKKFGINEVNTGWRYSSSVQDFPEYQYCYALKYYDGESTPSWISLANVSKGLVNSELTQKVAKETKTSMSVLENLLLYCRWAKA